MNVKLMKLPPRKKLWGWDYNKNRELQMTGKEWHEYARRPELKTERGGDSAFGGGVEVWLDGKNVNRR
jgi:hypothetical protein